MPRKSNKRPAKDDEDVSASIDDINIRCPITYCIMEDPVVLQGDGFTYEREAITAWLNINNRSPMTNQNILNTTLISNNFARSLIHTWKENREKEKAKKAEEKASRDRQRKRRKTRRAKEEMEKAREEVSNFVEIKNVQSLGKIFEKIDPLRNILSLELDGWSPPKFIVLGAEDSGKSTLLDRITMLPMFPQGRNICTRLPIEVQLRRARNFSGVEIQVYNTETNPPLAIDNTKEICAAALAEKKIRSMMEKVIKEQNAEAKLSGVSLKRKIVLKISRHNLPNLDLLDLPGLVLAAKDNEPQDMKLQTLELAKKYVELGGASSLYLWTTPANLEVTQSPACDIINSGGRRDRTVGVLTKADKVDLSDEQDVEALNERLNGKDFNLRNGFFTTMLKPMRKSSKKMSPDTADINVKLLYDQAKEEMRWFKSKLPNFDETRVGCNALIDSLSNIFLEFISDSWIPETLWKIRNRKIQLHDEDFQLGDPAPSNKAKWKLIGKKFGEIINTVAQAQASIVYNNVLHTVENDVVNIVQSSGVLFFSDLKKKLKDLKQAVEKTCFDALENAVNSVKAGIKDSLNNDTTPLKAGRFPRAIEMYMEYLQDWMRNGSKFKKEQKKLREHINTYFKVSPINTEFQIKTTFDGNNICFQIVAGAQVLSRCIILQIVEYIDQISIAATTVFKWPSKIERETCASKRQEILDHQTALASAATNIENLADNKSKPFYLPKIKKWVHEEINITFELNWIYHASHSSCEGINANKFYENCGGKKMTVIVVRALSNEIFGGFVNESWEGGYNQYKSSDKSFLFSVRKGLEEKYIKIPRINTYSNMQRRDSEHVLLMTRCAFILEVLMIPELIMMCQFIHLPTLSILVSSGM
eukprot:g9974.t1